MLYITRDEVVKILAVIDKFTVEIPGVGSW
jgi:hypothetical protein